MRATTLLYASPYGPNHPFSLADRTWMAWVEKRSGGELRIRPVWSGGLLSSDQSLVELRHGVADIGLITPIYARGTVQLVRVQTGFYGGARTVEQQVALYRCLAAAEPELDHELQGLKVLAVQGGNLPGILTRAKPISRMSDLRGLRIRAPTEMLSVLRDLGADPVNMPMGDVYSAMAKGVLDGVVAPMDALRSMHFAEVGKYYWMIEIPRGAYPARAIATRRWAALTATERAVLEESTAIWESALASQMLTALRSGEEVARRSGVRFQPALPEEQRNFDALYEKNSAQDAENLSRFGINGRVVFQRARRIAHHIERTGTVDCSPPLSTP